MNPRDTPQMSLDMARGMRRYQDMLRRLQGENRDLKKQLQTLQSAEMQTLAQAAADRAAHEVFEKDARSKITTLTSENASLKTINAEFGKSIMASREEAAELRLANDEMKQELQDLGERLDVHVQYHIDLQKFMNDMDRLCKSDPDFVAKMELSEDFFDKDGQTKKLEEKIKTNERQIEYLSNDVKALNDEVFQHEEKAEEHRIRAELLAAAQQRNAGLLQRNADLEALVENLLPQCRFPFNVRAFLRQRARERGIPCGFDSPSHFPSDDFDDMMEA